VVRLAYVYTDADTGNELVFFVRRKRWVCYLRDVKTKRFIKGLRNVEIRCYLVVDYSVERAKKRNPLYIDLVVRTVIQPHEILELHEIMERLEDAGRRIVQRFFGYWVSRLLLSVSGYEFGSRITVFTLWKDRRCSYTLMWKHHPSEIPNKVEGEEWL